MNKNANFGPNLVVFGQKILIFIGEIKSFVTHVTENPSRYLVRIVFWSPMGSNGPKMPIFDQKYQFWAKFGRFWAKNPNFHGSKQKFWYLRNGKTTKAPSSHHGTKWAKNANIWPNKPILRQIWLFMGQTS